MTFEVPEVLIERDIDRRTQDFIRHLIEERIDPRQAGIDWEAFRNEQRPPAEEAVKAMIVLDEVGRREQLAVSDEDLDREVAGFAERSGRAAVGRARAAREGRRTGAAADGNAAGTGRGLPPLACYNRGRVIRRQPVAHSRPDRRPSTGASGAVAAGRQLDANRSLCHQT